MFDYNSHIEKMKKASAKLVTFIESKGYTFVEKIDDFDNVAFVKDDFVYKISYRCFYRISGCCVIYKNIEKKNGQILVEPIFLTNEMFYDIYLKDQLSDALEL